MSEKPAGTTVVDLRFDEEKQTDLDKVIFLPHILKNVRDGTKRYLDTRLSKCNF
jgi:hypothetical protein